jgi:predicted unusual protein kinase regulating ubiquinone biosynthesis (AarF/ABC1/UbiB family)
MIPIIEAQLSRTYKIIGNAPIGVGSFGQVYKARLNC